MTTDNLIQAAEFAFTAIEAFTDHEGKMPESTGEFRELTVALEKLRAALAEAKQAAPAEQQGEPVAYWNLKEGFDHCQLDKLNEASKRGPAPVYLSANPQRVKAEPLTQDQIFKVAEVVGIDGYDERFVFARAVIAEFCRINGITQKEGE